MTRKRGTQKAPPMLRGLIAPKKKAPPLVRVKKVRPSINKQLSQKKYLSPSPMFKKESLLQRRLSRFGDVDMDGSPNQFDCSPRNVRKDGRITDVLKSLFFAKKPSTITYEREYPTGETVTKKYNLDTQEEIKEKPSTLKKVASRLGGSFLKGIEPTKNVSVNIRDKDGKIKTINRRVRDPNAYKKTVSRTLGAVLPGALPESVSKKYEDATSSKKRRPGRPKGTLSGKYIIPGRGAVRVDEYRKWKAKQNEISKIKEEVRVPQRQPVSSQAYEGYEQEYEDYEEEAPQTSNSQDEELVNDYQAAKRYEAIRRAQMVEQQNDNILKAPQFMKGELKATGGNILTPNGPNILDAPNINRGEMRNVGQEEKPAVKLSARPQTNPYGEYYIEIDPVSGKELLRKRISEKWLTGEAL